MGKHTDYTRRWLDRRFRRGEATDAPYFAHQPIYGFGHPSSEPQHARRYARTFQILRRLARIEFDTLLDVGGAEGFLSERARRTLGCRALSSDLSVEACRRAWELFEIDSIAVSSHALPFPDDSFDVVLCSEVIEHVEFAIETLTELTRVARKAVILTTEECEHDRAGIETELFQRCGYPHFERNLFHPDDLRTMFGDDIDMRSQFLSGAPPDSASLDEVKSWIRTATDFEGFVDGAQGVVMTALLDPSASRHTPEITDDALLEAMLEPAHAVEPLGARSRPDPLGALGSCAVCPVCRGALSGSPLRCGTCASAYAVIDGVADLASPQDPDRASTAAMLAKRWSGPRVDAALALRDALDLPFDRERQAWDFRDPEQRRGWLPNEYLQPSPQGAADRNGWCFRSTGDTPFFVSPGLGVSGASLDALEVTLRIHNPDFPIDAGEAQLFWLTEDDDEFSQDRHAIFRLVNDGARHDYRLELHDLPGWPTDKDIVCVRFDPANGPCDLEIVSLRFV